MGRSGLEPHHGEEFISDNFHAYGDAHANFKLIYKGQIGCKKEEVVSKIFAIKICSAQCRAVSEVGLERQTGCVLMNLSSICSTNSVFTTGSDMPAN